MLPLTGYIKIFTALISIVDPIGAVPIVVSLTAGMSEKERRSIAPVTGFAVGVILVSSALFGKFILSFFGISIGSFKIGGGIIILLMAVAMMQAHFIPGRQTTEEYQEAEEKKSIAVVPIAMPLLAGPAAISAVIVYSQALYEPLHIIHHRADLRPGRVFDMGPAPGRRHGKPRDEQDGNQHRHPPDGASACGNLRGTDYRRPRPDIPGAGKVNHFPPAKIITFAIL